MVRHQFIELNNELFVVKRKFRQDSWMDLAIQKFGVKEVCEAYHCERVLRGGDGYFYLVDLVEEAKII